MDPNEMLDDRYRELQQEIEERQKELNEIKLGDVREAENEYRHACTNAEAAKENYEEAVLLVKKAARVVHEEKIKSGKLVKLDQHDFMSSFRFHKHPSINNLYRF